MDKSFSCYFAHPYESRGTPEEDEIIEELKSRRVDVINPFDGEDEMMLEKFGRTNYYPDPPFSLGVGIWTQDISRVSKCDMLLVYVPDGTRLSGGCGIELWLAHQQHKFIQIISKSHHPAFAYVLSHTKGAQMYLSIEDWKKYNQYRWE